MAIGPHDAQTPDELVRVARPRDAGGQILRPQPGLPLDARGQERLDRRGRLRRELGQAIAGDGLSTVFQPVWHLREQRLAGVELLARWHDATLGAVSPAEFIPLAEESRPDRRAGPVGRAPGRVGGAALRRAAGPVWRADVRVAVNLSTLQLADTDLVATLTRVVREAVAETGLAGVRADRVAAAGRGPIRCATG